MIEIERLNQFFQRIIEMSEYRNKRMLEFMKTENISTIIVDRFSKTRYPELNKSFRTNFFSLDELGIPIRRELEGHDNKFGWKKIGDRFFHFRVNDAMIDQVKPSELRRITLDSIRFRWPKEFKDGEQFAKQLKIANSILLRDGLTDLLE